MDIIRAAGLASIAIAAGLTFLLNRDPADIRANSPTPDSRPEVEVRVHSPIRNTSVTVSPSKIGTLRGTPPADLRPVHGKPLESGDGPAGGPNFDTPWPMLLYPELAAIAESESLPADSALGSLQPMLDDSDPVIRLAALEALADLGRQAPLTAVVSALADPSPQIRIAALDALAIRRDSATVAGIEALAFDPEPRVRTAAVEALAIIGDRSSVHTLGALLGDPDDDVKRGAVGALGEIGGDIAIGYLRQLRYDPDDSIRASANAILREEALAAD